MIRPLEGIRVLDLSQLYPGPYCTMILADLGAEVIKVEPPKYGDFGRLFSSFFKQVNRNKKSITLNLKEKRGQQILYKLVEKADVFVEGFRPGKMDNMGIDYNTLKNINPRIIYCSISGFGQDGPYRDKSAHDLIYQSIGGVLGMLKDRNGRTIEPGIEIADVTAGLNSAIAILAALMARDKTNKGQFLDISITDCATASLCISAGYYLEKGKEPEKPVTIHLFPAYGVFDTADGQQIIMGIVHEDWFWKNFCSALGIEKFANYLTYDRIDKREDLRSFIEEVIKKKTLAELFSLFEGWDIPYASANNLDQVFTDPHILHRQMKVTMESREGSIDVVGSPLKFSETPVQYKLTTTHSRRTQRRNILRVESVPRQNRRSPE